MKPFLAALALIVPAALPAQSNQQPESAAAARLAQYKRHLVLITRAGPRFGELSSHPAEARTHHALWKRLSDEGHTIAGGAFVGEPVMGMTVFSEGINEARARELIKDDPFPNMGFTQYEFRTLMVVNGAFRRS